MQQYNGSTIPHTYNTLQCHTTTQTYIALDSKLKYMDIWLWFVIFSLYIWQHVFMSWLEASVGSGY